MYFSQYQSRAELLKRSLKGVPNVCIVPYWLGVVIGWPRKEEVRNEIGLFW